MKILTYIARIFLGSLFIVSGLIKANDTLGFSYKLEEYFEDGALAYRIRDWFGWDTFSLEFLVEYALLIAVVMCVAEIVLGFSVLFGTKVKTTLYSLIILTTMFFFLTLHTATCDPDGSYNDLTVVKKNTPEYTQLKGRMQGDEKIKVIKEDDKEAVFQEEMPVQCVSDCGCFGDAMKGSLGRSMTPWESWSKDVILMIFIIPIFFYRKKIKINTAKEDLLIFITSIIFTLFLSWVFNWYFPLVFFSVGYIGFYASKRLLFNSALKWIPMVWALTISLTFIYYTLNHLPIKDYRPYAIGKNIPEQKVLPKDAKQDVFENIFYYKNKTTEKVEEFNEKNYPWDDSNYVFVDRKTELISAGDKALTTDFSIMADDGNDYSQDYFDEESYVFMYIAYDINKADEASIKKFNTFVSRSNMDGNIVIGLTSSTYNDVEDFKLKNQLMLDFYTCDAVTLKTIIRANPGVILMKKGTILGKWNANELPDYETVKKDFLK